MGSRRIKWTIYLAWMAMKNELRALVSKGGRETSQNLKADGRILLKRVMTKMILVCEVNSAGLGKDRPQIIAKTVIVW